MRAHWLPTARAALQIIKINHYIYRQVLLLPIGFIVWGIHEQIFNINPEFIAKDVHTRLQATCYSAENIAFSSKWHCKA